MTDARYTLKRALLLIAAAVWAQAAWAGAAPDGGVISPPVQPDFYLTFTPSMPSPGQPVIVSMVWPGGVPEGASINWNLSGAPTSDSGIDRTDGTRFHFTPNGPGSYNITGNLFMAHGEYRGSSSLEIVIGEGPTAWETGGAEMYLDVMPAQPRIGQTVTFTMRFGGGIPAGGTVRWDVSGGQTANMTVGGANREVCSFIPGIQAQHFVNATLHDAQGSLLGDISLGFVPIP